MRISIIIGFRNEMENLSPFILGNSMLSVSNLQIAAVLIATVLITPVVANYLRTTYATGLVFTCTLSLTTGIILDTVIRSQQELRLLAYLWHPTSEPSESQR